MSDPYQVMTKVEQCWHDGVSIGATIVSVKRLFGTKLSADDVQATFARLSQEFAPRSSKEKPPCQ